MKICVIGDSISFGCYDFEEGGYIKRLEQHIINKIDSECKFTNLSFPGFTSTDALKRFKRNIKTIKADVIIIAIGTNDSQYLSKRNRFRTEEKLFLKNISSIIDKSLKITENVIVIGTGIVNEEKTNPFKRDLCFYNDILNHFNDLLISVASKFSVSYIDIKKACAFEDLSDGLHPNKTGHKKIFNHIKDDILRIIFEEA